MPELVVIFPSDDGVPYGQCSACNRTFELVMIGSDSDNTLELHSQFMEHLEVEHRD